ncbi:PIF1-like helicase-domain-containing protein [Flammula alnicola]|nr:PIF1-like helicase-domain-containing protein [Flammula alnicola]
MFKPSNPAKSGLGTVKRDWSSSDVAQAPKSSQEIYWPPTPPVVPQAPAKKLTGSEQRLKAIQEALAGYPSSAPPPLAPSTLQNKRPSPNGNDATMPPKRARQLPLIGMILSRPPACRTRAYNQDPHLRRTIPVTLHLVLQRAHPVHPQSQTCPVFLSQEQTQILKLVQEGESVFYTGSAGTGKSVLLREIIKTLRKKHAKSIDAVAITASTGIAACNIGGVTIHSFAGIGLGIEPAEDLVIKIKKNKKAATRWARTKRAFTSVSMIDGDLFDKLAKIGSILRRGGEPFGGHRNRRFLPVAASNEGSSAS